MFRSGMVEGKEGKIRVPPGVSLQAYRGLLEFVYLGESLCEIWRFMFVLHVMMDCCACVFVFTLSCVRWCVVLVDISRKHHFNIFRQTSDIMFDILGRAGRKRVRQGRRARAVGARGVVRGGGDAGLAAG